MKKKTKYPVYVKFPGKVLIVGFGSIGQGVLPLILRHIGIDKKNIHIITAAPLGRDIARAEGVSFEIKPLRKHNYRKILDAYLEPGDFLLNLSVEVSSIALIEYCAKRNILYLDTVVEPWLGGYTDPSLSISERSNYGLRETLLALKKKHQGGPTAVSCHGANPGIVSHFVKQALLNIAKKLGKPAGNPRGREEWAALMRKLGVKTVHIAEYDSQVADSPKKIGRFENTWSVNGFHSEGICQPCEMGWGTHEKQLPKGGSHHTYGCGAAIYLDRPGARVLVRTWTPLHGPFLGRAVTHNESVSIADYFSIRAGRKTVFRPTVHYAYRSCDVSILSIEECFGRGSVLQKEERILMDEITTGMDELGVLLMGDKHGAYWYGSRLTIEATRKLAPYQNATGLQVTAGALGGMIWAMENPRAGIVEADEIDHERVMEIITPYMGKMVGAFTDWTPLKSADAAFATDIDKSDPWQFKNFLFS
ncbi:homospermidine synthase [Candidatus Kaiserbacteria bacterium RIFCSPLOWO2_01_FULL_54_22]|nr:MAG: homospermidine synthase [Candidatus Kaiserbacteria bacterium RIFCSPLOWO2_01_FULL_54_22]